jgi:hypothetical protein
MAHPDTQDVSFIGAVFTAPNLLRYPIAAASTANPESDPVRVAAPAIIAFLNGNRDWPLMLPRCAAGDDSVTWYACAHSEAHLRGLQAEMRAFIGPTFSYFPSVRALLDHADGIERAIDIRFEGRVLKIDVPKRYVEKVNQQLERFIGLLMRRPAIATHAVASFSQLRARFDMALLAGNESAAQECLNALITRNLSAENRHFLNIRFYAALGQWNKIAEYPLLPALISLKLPPETYSDIFEALYQTLLHSAEESKDLETLLERFDERLFQAYPVLFRTRRNSIRPAVLKGAICRELTLATPDPQQCLALLSQLPTGAFPASIEAQIRARCEKLQAPDPGAAALEALNAEEFDRAFELYLGLPLSSDVLCALLRCAREIGDPATAGTVMALLDAAPQELRATAAKRSPRMYKIVSDLAQSVSVIPASLERMSLLEQLAWLQDDGETAEEYVARLREGAASWEIEELLSEINCGPKAAEVIETLSIEAPEVFEQAFPLWYRLFIERLPVPDSRLVPVYLALMATMRVRATYGEDELTLIKRAASCVLECGVNRATYGAMVGDLSAILDDTRSVYSLDWAIDLADQMLVAACAAPEVRMRFLAGIISLANQFVRRLTPLQCKLVQRIAAESGFEFKIVPVENLADEESPATAITGRVAIYTLDSATAGRARDMLMESYPNLRVDLNHDQVCTTELRNLAKQVDWFAFAWRCATHQAWFCVKGALGDTGKLCWAKGNGAASLAQVIEQRLLAPPDADPMVE